MVAHVEPGLPADVRRQLPARPHGRRPRGVGQEPDQLGVRERRAPGRHRHPEGELRDRHQPLPGGRLQELPGDRRHHRQRAGVPARTRPRPGDRPEHAVRRRLLPARRCRRARVRAVPQPRDLRPERADRRPRHRGALATARPAGRPRPDRPPAGVHPQARGPRHLQEPERPVPRGGPRRQRAQVREGRRGAEPQRRERADPGVPHRRRERHQLHPLRDPARRPRPRTTRT